MEIAPVCNLSTRNYAAAISGGTITADDWVRHLMQPGLQAFEAMLAPDSRFCHGDSITMAFIMLVPQIYNARRLGLDLASLPKVAAVIAALEAIPAIAAAHPDQHAPARS